MAQYDMHRDNRGQLVVNCQSDQLARLNTRFVIPLMPVEDAPAITMARLNPIFDFEGRQFVLTTQFAATVRSSSLGPVVGSVERDRLRITAALDLLITGV